MNLEARDTAESAQQATVSTVTDEPRQPARRAGAERPRNVLAAAIRVLAALDKEHVRYCHWKSVWRIDRSLRGEADLDLLIDRRQSRYAQEVLGRCGFKRFAATEATGYAAVEDYVGLDADAGRLIHCHVHYRLILGEPNLKSYRLPWEKLLLDTRRLDAATNIYVAESNLEMLVLLIRYATKLRYRNIAGYLLGRDWFRELVAEYDWIRARVDPATCVGLCHRLLGEEAGLAFAELLRNPLTLGRLLRFRRAADVRLRLFRRYGLIARSLLRWRRGAASLVGGVNQRYLSSRRPRRRSVPTGGVVIALIGPDGCGKSTLARDTATLLAQKLDVLLIYFGSGAGPGSLLRWPLDVLRALAARLSVLPRGRGLPASLDQPEGGHAQRRSPIWSLALIVWALVLAREKRRKLRTAWKARDSGVIVLTDRYPQAQVLGFNDGPLLGHLANHRSRVLRWIASREAAPYQWAELYPPDLVIKLNVSTEMALRRKPDTGLREAKRRIEAVRKLTYPAPTAVADVDANRPLPAVRSHVYKIVWEHI